VDDTGIAHTRDRMVGAITNSILAANVVFGFPDEDRRTPCLNPFKWSPIATHTLRFLGYFIDTRTLTVQWPDEKHAQLAACLTWTGLIQHLGGNPTLTPRQIARSLGLVWHGFLVSPLGSFLSLRLQFTLNDAIRSQKRRVTKRWWHTSSVRIPDEAVANIRLLRLFLEPETHQHL